jgi:glycosyltransferase involved in cell wall biosynthesis
MKILFDPQVFQLGYSGMRRYYSVLYSGLRDAGIEIVYPQKSPFSPEPIEQTYWEKPLPKKVKRVVDKFTFYRIREHYYKAISTIEYDLVYITSPSFETKFLNHIQNKPFVMTVHDTMQIARGLHTLVDQPRDTMALGYLANHAERVATVSSYTKNDLCNQYMVEPAKTQTVHLANFLSSDAEMITDLPERYILNVGSRNGRKNFYAWIKAVASSLKNHPDLYVIITGALTRYEEHFYEKLGVSNQILIRENVTDAQLVTLYQRALCLVYPTLYEGFGLPVIEAMANGCPVIASHYTSIPEVAGQAALYIDPMDPKSMLNAFEKFVETPILQKELSEKGLEQSQKFSKEKFITGMINVFESAVRDFKK